MPKYAPGTMGFDLANNAGLNKDRRRADIASGLLGVGGLFNTMANIGQRNQAYADEQAALPYMAQAYDYQGPSLSQGMTNPTRGSVPEGLDRFSEGPQPSPYEAAAAQAAGQQTPSFWQNIGTAFGGQRQGRITPQALERIGSVQSRAVNDRRLSAAEAQQAEMFPLRRTYLEAQTNRLNAAAERDRAWAPNGGGNRSPTDHQEQADYFKARQDLMDLDNAEATAARLIDPKTGAIKADNASLTEFMTLSKAQQAALTGSPEIRDRLRMDATTRMNISKQRLQALGRLPPDPDQTPEGKATIDNFLKDRNDKFNNPFGMPQQGPTQAAPPARAPQSAAPIQGQGDDESRLTNGGQDPEMVQAITTFKAAHPGAPFDAAAFMGWLGSGR